MVSSKLAPPIFGFYYSNLIRNLIAILYSNNLDDVREEWERIRLSYEILSDKTTRRRYDRHIAIADPQGAMGRAAIGAVGKGISGLGHGLFSMGAFVVQQITKERGEHAG